MDGLKLVPIEYGDQFALQRQGKFLYELLQERPPEANISHREIPPFWKHLEFVSSRPYAAWNIIELDGVPVGSVYLTEPGKHGCAGDEVGIFVSKRVHGMGIGAAALKLFMDANPRAKYLANIAPGNSVSQDFFRGLGFKCIQFTYAKESQ